MAYLQDLLPQNNELFFFIVGWSVLIGTTKPTIGSDISHELHVSKNVARNTCNKRMQNRSCFTCKLRSCVVLAEILLKGSVTLVLILETKQKIIYYEFQDDLAILYTEHRS